MAGDIVKDGAALTWHKALELIKGKQLTQAEAARRLGVKRQHVYAVLHGKKPIPKFKRPKKESAPMPTNPTNSIPASPLPDLRGPLQPNPSGGWGGFKFPDTLDGVKAGPPGQPSLSPADPPPTAQPDPVLDESGDAAPAGDPPSPGLVDHEAADVGTKFLMGIRNGLFKLFLRYHGIDPSDPRVLDMMPEDEARTLRKSTSTLEFVLKQNPQITQRVGKAAKGWPGVLAGIFGEAFHMKRTAAELAAKLGIVPDEDEEETNDDAGATQAGPTVGEQAAPPAETPAFDLGAAINAAQKPDKK